MTVRRGRNPVVAGLSLRLRPGRPFWIVGPNGAGKSSLLRVLAGLDRAAGGSVTRAPEGEPFLYFESEMRLPDASTVGEWARLGRTLLPPDAPGHTPLWPTAEPRRRVARMSTGERKRLLLDVLLRSPGSLLLDEPYEHLSPAAKADLTTLLDRRARGHVVVIATNQVTERALADGGLRLEAGEAEPLGRASARGLP